MAAPDTAPRPEVAGVTPPTGPFENAATEDGGTRRSEPVDASAAIDTFLAGLGRETPAKGQLAVLWAEAGHDIEKFRQNLERWFDAQMNRVSGIYKAQVRVILLILGVAVAGLSFGLGLRSDALALITNLQEDQNLRAVIVSAATSATSANLAQEGGCLPSGTANSASVSTPPSRIGCEITGLSKLTKVNLALETGAPSGKPASPGG